jgi:hypothetical protein
VIDVVAVVAKDAIAGDGVASRDGATVMMVSLAKYWPKRTMIGRK